MITENNMPNTLENKTFRFKFSTTFIEHITSFAKLYQSADRHTYKEEWIRWTTNNNELIETETQLLRDKGYNGNIMDKMYRSGRFYFRTKTPLKNKPKERRDYIFVNQQILDVMNKHITANLLLSNFKPSFAYQQFTMENKDVLEEEINRLLQENISKNDIMNKLKKTYKNRCFILKDK
jgi:hypothetical protein